MKKIIFILILFISYSCFGQDTLIAKGGKKLIDTSSLFSPYKSKIQLNKDSIEAHNTRIGAVTVSDALKAPLISPSFTTPSLGAATATSLAIGEVLKISSIFDVASTTKGLLIPRMSTTNRNTISTPDTGLLVYNTTTNTIDAFNGTSWNIIAGNSDNELLVYQALGSPMQATTVVPLSTMATSTALTAGRCTWTAFTTKKEITVTGVMYWMATQGNFTGSNFNGIGVYSYNAGTMTLIDTSARDENIWKATSSTWNQKALANGPKVLQPGTYYIMCLYNSSAQTTAPSLGSLVGNTQTIAPLTTNSAKLFSFVNGTNTPPATQAMSGTTAGTYYGLVPY